MSIASSFRKGLRFLLMSMGVSSPDKSKPEKSPRPREVAAPKVDAGK
jgi:hypothetical protein